MSRQFFCFIMSLLMFFVVGCIDEPEKGKDTGSSKNIEIPDPGYLTETLEKMQGRWVNALEKGLYFTVEKNVYTGSEPGKKETVAVVEAYRNCPNYCNLAKADASDYPCFILKKNRTAGCFFIVKLTEEEFHFTPIGGKPEVKVFRKADL